MLTSCRTDDKGSVYEMYNATVFNERMAEKAVVLPRLIRLTRTTIMLITSTYLSRMRRLDGPKKTLVGRGS